MFKSLYDQFAHWYHGGSIWLYSDPHFSDEEMKHIRRNYIGDDEQVRRINSKIGKNDTLIILGDVGNVEFVKKLRGYKVLVMGNHDAGATNYKKKDDNHLFDEVYEGALFISDKIVLSHEPIDFPFALNIHGHDHSMWSGADSLHLNVCAEHINYTPVCLKNIIESGILKKISSIHRITIDQATARKKSHISIKNNGRKVEFNMSWDKYGKNRVEEFYTRVFGHKVKCIGVAKNGTPLLVSKDET